MERLQPLSKLVIKNDKTINQEAFNDFAQSFLEYLESLNSPPPYQCNRSNKSTVLKYNSFLFQIITKYPQMVILISPNLLQICNLLMNPLNDNQIREDTWRLLINSINCYDVLIIFKAFLSKAFLITPQESRLDIGEVGKASEESLFKQFEQIIIKLKKSPDFDKAKVTIQLILESITISILKSFSLQFRNKIISTIISEVGLLEKKFKTSIFDDTIEPRLAIYISEIFSFIPIDQSYSHIIYRFIKWTFPYAIESDQKEDLTKRASMLLYINRSKYRGSLALSYFRVKTNDSINSSIQLLSKTAKDCFHNIFIRIIDRSIQILPSMIQVMKSSSDNYAYMYNMCKFFTHVLRLKGLTRSLLPYESEKSVIGYFLLISISIYNLQFDLLPFMTLFFLSFMVDKKYINLSEEGHFSDNISSIVHPNYVPQVIQVVSIFASQITVGLTPSIFSIRDEKLKKQFLNNPVIFEKEKIQNLTLRNMLKQSSSQFNIPPTNASNDDLNSVDSMNIPMSLMRSNSSDNFFKLFKSVHFFFNIDCRSYTKSEATEFLLNYIQCFSKLTNDALVPIVLDTFSCIIELLSNFKNALKMNQISVAHKNIDYDFDFTFVTDTFLPFAFKKLLEYEPSCQKRVTLFCAVARMIRVLNENFLNTLSISKLWCVSMLSTLQKNPSIASHAAIQACLEGFPYSFSLAHAIFICHSDRKVRDVQTVAYLTCMSIISPEFRNYSLQELEIIASSSRKLDSNMACMSILLLLHNLFNESSQKVDDSKKNKIDKEVHVIFLDSLSKMRSSPLLMSSLLHVLPPFFSQLDSHFELFFDTILMDVNEVMMKIMNMTSNTALKQASSLTVANNNNNNNNNGNNGNFPLNSFASQTSVISSLPKNRLFTSPPITFMQSACSDLDTQPDSDPVLNTNLSIKADDCNVSSQLLKSYDYLSIQIFKSITSFCVKLFLHSKEKAQIKKRIIELFQSWSNCNNRRTDGQFYAKFKQILNKSVGFCYAPPKSKFAVDPVLFKQNDTFFVSKNSPSIFIVNDSYQKVKYDVKISLEYSSSIYSVKPLRQTLITTARPSAPLELKSKNVPENKDVSKSKLNLFRNLRNKISEQPEKVFSAKNHEVAVPGLSLVFDALEEATGSRLEEKKESAALQADFTQQFHSNFKKQIFIRLMFFGKRISKTSHPLNEASQSNSTTNNTNNSRTNNNNKSTTNNTNNSRTNNNNKSTTNNTNTNNSNTNNSSTNTNNINNNSNNKRTTKDTNTNNNNNNKRTTNDSNNNSNKSTTNNSDNNSNKSANNDNDKKGAISDSYKDSVNDKNSKSDAGDGCFDDLCLYGEFDNKFSPLFRRFLASLGERDSRGDIWAATTFYDAIYQMRPSSGQNVAVVWVDNSIFTSSIIKQLALEHRYLFFIILTPTKSGIIHTKVLYSSLLLDAENQPNEANNNNNIVKESKIYYFNSYYNYKYPFGEKMENSSFFFCSFGPLVGSLFLPYTLVPRLVTETAINSSVFRNIQLKNMSNNQANKKKKRKLFPHRP